MFTAIMELVNVLYAIVVRNPAECECWSPKKGRSIHSLDEHIEFIRSMKELKRYSVCTFYEK